jgi:hypothetical protein
MPWFSQKEEAALVAVNVRIDNPIIPPCYMEKMCI